MLFSSKAILWKQDLSTVYIQSLGQKHRLAKLFDCVCVVWNDSLACCQEKYKLGKKKPTNSELQIIYWNVCENQTIVLEVWEVSRMVKNKKLSRAISQTGHQKITDIFRMDLQKNTVGI